MIFLFLLPTFLLLLLLGFGWGAKTVFERQQGQALTWEEFYDLYSNLEKR